MNHEHKEHHKLRILSLEDSINDFEIIQELLVNADFDFEMDRVENDQEFKKALSDNNYNIILSDFNLPGYDAFDALSVSLQLCPEIPFIVVSGSIGEETAIELIKKGAIDYILKDKPDKLQYSIKRALQEAKEKKELQIKEKALHESERKINTLLNNLDGIVYRCKNDKNWTMEFISDCFHEITGYNNSDIINNNKISYAELVLLEDRDKQRDIIQNALNNKSRFELKYRIRTSEGKILNVLEKGVGVYSNNGEVIALEGFIMDITQQVKDTYALRESEELNRSITHSAADAIISINSKGYVESWNNAAEQIFGYAESEMLSSTLLKIIPDEFRKGHKNGLKSLLEYSEKFRNRTIEINAVRKNGVVFPIELSMSAWNSATERFYTGIIRDITERKLNENKISKLSSVVEQSPTTIVITDLHGNIEYINQKFTELTGYISSEVEGKNVKVISSGKQSPEYYENLWVTIKGGFIWQGEFYNRKKNGELFWESATISPFYDNSDKVINYIKVGEDITQQKLAAEIMEESILQYKTLFNQIADPVFVFDKESKRFLDFNDASKNKYGYSDVEFKQMTPIDLNAMFEDNAYVEKNIDDTDDNTPNDYLHKSKDGSEFYVQTHTKEIVYKGVDSWITIIRDITESKRSRQELTEALNRATESDRLKTAFLQNISHEIRTPMNGIFGFASLLKNSQLSGEVQQSYIDIIMKSGKRMLDTLKDLMDISMLESGQIIINNTQTNIKNELISLCDFFKKDVDEKGMQIKCICALKIDETTVFTDKEKLIAILSNLIKNAIKYSDEGIILVTSSIAGDLIEFSVEDNGIGIPVSRQTAIFDRFVQADIEDVKVYEGSGLGLSISKEYVELLGGKIWVESVEYEGSKFCFTIPYSPVLSKIEKQDVVIPKNDLFGLKILIVEDEVVSNEYLCIILDDISNTILHASTGKEAIEICRENMDFDIILMDVKMPLMNGYSATKKIREFNNNVIIIAQTAYALPGDRENAIAAGCNDYITKPLEKDSLIELIATHIEKKSTRK
jgi:PAS domain S-box-containing protein